MGQLEIHITRRGFCARRWGEGAHGLTSFQERADTMIWLARRLIFFWKLVHVRDTPRRLALGLACGLLLGLLPKGNLLAVAIAAIVFATRINLPVATAVALLVSLVGTWLDPVANWLGRGVLQQPWLAPFWRWLYALPLAPWTSFNNTVVMGHFLIGLALLYPAYRLSLPWFVRYRAWLDARDARQQSAHQPVASPIASPDVVTVQVDEPLATDSLGPQTAVPRVAPVVAAPEPAAERAQTGSATTEHAVPAPRIVPRRATPRPVMPKLRKCA